MAGANLYKALSPPAHPCAGELWSLGLGDRCFIAAFIAQQSRQLGTLVPFLVVGEVCPRGCTEP